jgi:type II secretory pathway component GspD/PulD (secretin)
VANEEKAVIDMTTKEPYVVVSRQKGTEQSPGDTITTTLSVIPGKSEPFVGEAFFSYGITVNVTPRVNTASNITVTIEPSISKRIGTAATPGDTVYPIIEMKKITTIFSLGDGRTAAIGGLTRTEDQDIVKKVPLLGDIPILGKYLFSHSERVKQQKEIIIFVTVGVVTSESASGVSLPEGAKLVQQHVDSDGHLIKAPAAGDAAKAKDKKEKPAAE